MVKNNKYLESRKNSITSLLGVGMIFFLTLFLVFKTTSLKAENESNTKSISGLTQQSSFHLTPISGIEKPDFFAAEEEEKSDDDESSFKEIISFYQNLFPTFTQYLGSFFYEISCFKATPLFLLFGQLKIPFC